MIVSGEWNSRLGLRILLYGLVHVPYVSQVWYHVPQAGFDTLHPVITDPTVPYRPDITPGP